MKMLQEVVRCYKKWRNTTLAVGSAISYEAIHAVTHFPSRAVCLIIAGGIRVAGGTNICPNYNICRHMERERERKNRRDTLN